MTFEYLERVVVEGELEVENIGDCVILGRTDLGEEYYLVIKTLLGWTEVIEYGPAVPDIEMLPASVSLRYNRFEYSEFKLEKIIDKFLNDGRRGITQAQTVQLSDIYDLVINPIDRMLALNSDAGEYND